jgi:hypothetical protein
MRGKLAGLLVFLLLALLSGLPGGAVAQEAESPWSQPTLIYSTTGVLATSSMAMVSDQSGGVHLFFGHQPEAETPYGLDYLHWDGESWRGPYNVLVNADGSNVGHVRATIDAEQTIHLIWGGGGNQLYYASAPAADAEDARRWSKPLSLGEAITEAGIAAAENGTLVVAYSNASAMGTVAVTISNDGGRTWSNPTTSAVLPEGFAADAVSVAVDGAGRLHVTWTAATLPSGDPYVGVFYARSLDGGETWSAPFEFDDDRHGEICVGTVGDDEVHLVWRSNIGGDGTFHQWSADGGETWSGVDQYEDRGGMSGLPSFAVDSTGTLHYVIGPGYVATFRDGALGPYVDAVGQELRSGDPSTGWTAPERAVIAITTGNRLHVVFETGFQSLWHTEQLLAVPKVAPLPLPTPAVVVAVATPIGQGSKPQATSMPSTPSSEATALDPMVQPTAAADYAAPAQASPLSPLLAGIVPVLLLVLAVVAVRVYRGHVN